MAFTKILGPGIHTLANFHSHNINSSGIITATKFVGDMEPGGGTGSFDSLTVTGNLGVGGTVTYTDVTNVDAVGIITAQSGIYIGAGATVGSLNTTTGISSFKTLNVDETSTLNGSVGIADSIIHIGNTDTSIRFPSDDTFTIETAGSEALRIDSTGRLLLNTTTEGNPNADDFTISFNNTGVSGGDQGRCGMTIRSGDNTSGVTQPGYIYFSDGTSGDNESKGAIAYDHNVDDMYLATDGVERLRIGSTGISTFLKDLHVAQSGTGSTVFINSTTHNTSVASIAMLKLGYTHSGGQAVGYLKLQEGGGNSFDGNLTVGVPYNQGGGSFGTRDALTVKYSGDVYLYGATAGVTSCFWDASADTLIFNDDVTAAFGNGSDLKIYHNHQHSYIDETGTGNLYIRNGTKNSIWCETDGRVNLYHNDSAKLSTSSTGITVTGEVAASQDYPNIRPALDFNFASVKKLDPRITYSRTGPASYTDEFGIVKLVGDNTPRFDHDGATRESKGLLIEESRTNNNKVATNEWNATGWTSEKTNLEHYPSETAPDESTNVTLVYPTTHNDNHYNYISHAGNSYSGSRTCSAWFKKLSTTTYFPQLRIFGAGSGKAHAVFTLTGDGSVTSGGNATTNATITRYPNDWYYCTLSWTYASGHYGGGIVIGNDSSTELPSFTGDSDKTKGYLMWGFQDEVGTFPTSLIPTNGATATRGSDDLVIDGGEFDDFINKPEGTIVADYKVIGGDPEIMYLSNDNSNCRIGLYEAGSSQTRFLVNNAGTLADTTDSAGTTVGDNIKSAGAYKLNDVAASKNGVISSTDSSVTIPDGIDRAYIGGYYNGDVEGSLGLRRLVYYQQRLPNSQLVTLTA